MTPAELATATAEWLNVPEANLRAPVRVAGAVLGHASTRWVAPLEEDYDTAEGFEAATAAFEQALVMQCARLMMRAQAPTGTDAGGPDRPVVVHRFDADVRDLLSDFMIVGVG